MSKSVQEIANEIAIKETDYGGNNPESLTEAQIKFHETPTSEQIDRARKIWLERKVKKVVKKGVDKVKRYVAKDKAYTQQVRMATIEHEIEEERRKKKEYE